MSTTSICRRSMNVGTGTTSANSLGSPWKSLAMVRTVWSPSRTSATCEAWLKSLVSAFADVEAAEGQDAVAGQGGQEHESEDEGAFHARPPERRSRPAVARPGQQPIEERNRRSEHGQGPEEPVGAEEAELDVGGAQGHEQREQRCARRAESGVVRGSEIMKNAKMSRAPFWRRCIGMAMGSPSQSGAGEHQARVGQEEGEGHVAAGRAVDHDPAEAGEQEPEERGAAPLSRRDPGLAGQEEGHDREVRRIEDVFPAHADQRTC